MSVSVHPLTSGPTKKTVVDLWRMLWEKQVFIVVMTTKCVELGRHKCAQYWPEDGIASVTYGNVTVEVTNTQNLDGYDLRAFKVQSKVSVVRHSLVPRLQLFVTCCT